MLPFVSVMTNESLVTGIACFGRASEMLFRSSVTNNVPNNLAGPVCEQAGAIEAQG